MPQPLGVEWRVSVELRKPEQAGTVTHVELPLATAPWKAQLAFYWILPEDGGVDYVVTQIRILSDEHGLLAECSRYDKIDEILPFPVGACSGRMGEEMIGATFFR